MDQSGILRRASTDRSRPTENRRYLFAKRALDLTICLMALPLAVVLFGIITLLVMLDSPGPALLIQERIGKNGNLFRMFKFRTMKQGEPDQQERTFMQAYIQGNVSHTKPAEGVWMYKPDHSSRITRVGRILRKTSLDELPQLINILRGEMSLVGPRPNVPWEVDAYQEWHCERLKALPGVTGLAQVKGRSGLPFDSIVRLDLEYIQKQSLSFDIKILWWTFLAVLSRRGAG